MKKCDKCLKDFLWYSSTFIKSVHEMTYWHYSHSSCTWSFGHQMTDDSGKSVSIFYTMLVLLVAQFIDRRGLWIEVDFIYTFWFTLSPFSSIVEWLLYFSHHSYYFTIISKYFVTLCYHKWQASFELLTTFNLLSYHLSCCSNLVGCIELGNGREKL